MKIKKFIALTVVISLLVTCLRGYEKPAYAEGEEGGARVYIIVCDDDGEGNPKMGEGNVPIGLALIPDSSQIGNGKVLFTKFIMNGTYNMSEEDAGLPLLINNAVINMGEYDTYNYKMSGDSRLEYGDRTIFSSKDRFPELDTNDIDLDTDMDAILGAVMALYSVYPYEDQEEENIFNPRLNYSAEITGEYSMLRFNGDGSPRFGVNSENNEPWSGWMEAEDLTVKSGGSILMGGSIIMIHGSLSIEEGGKLVPKADAPHDNWAELIFTPGASVNGIDLKDYDDKGQIVDFDLAADRDWDASFAYNYEENAWFFNPGGPDDGINVGGRDVLISYQFGDGAFTELGNAGFIDRAMLDESGATSVTLKFDISDRGSEAPEIKGLKIWYKDGEDHHSVVPLNFTENIATYTINKVGENWYPYNIECMDWDLMFDNEYKVWTPFDQDITFTGAENDAVKSFTAGEEISFSTNISDPYVKVEFSDGDPIYSGDKDHPELVVNGKSITYTPGSDLGFVIMVYPDEAAMAFDDLHPDEDNFQYWLNTFTEGEGDGGYVSLSEGQDAIRNASYNGSIKLIINKNDNISIVSLDINLNEGFTYEVRNRRAEGATLSSGNESGTYEWPIEDTDEIEVAFISVDPGNTDNPDNPDNPGKPEKLDLSEIEAFLEETEFAYYANDGENTTEVFKDHLGTELSNQYFVREGAPYEGIFETMDDVKAAITVAATEKEQSETPIIFSTDGTTPLNYYEATMEIHNEDGSETATANIKIYKLNGEKDLVIKATKERTTSYKTINTGDDALNEQYVYIPYDCNEEGIPNVRVFGNGADFVNTWCVDDDSSQAFSGHVTTEHSGIDFGEDENHNKLGINQHLTIINTTIVAARVVGDGSNGTAAPWGWIDLDVVSTNGTSEDNPKNITSFIGNNAIYIYDFVHEEVSKEVASIECLLPNADKAVAISEKKTDEYGSYCAITPKSNYYDTIPLKITYANGEVGFITIKIVGLDINAIGRVGDAAEATVLHGTDCNTYYTFEENDRAIITATFYYPGGPQVGKDERDEPAMDKYMETLEQVNLYVTTTFKDGTVTKRTITERFARGWGGNNATSAFDDFLLWNGTWEDMPEKIEVLVMKPGSSDSGFAGAMLGAGAGVTWTRE